MTTKIYAMQTVDDPFTFKELDTRESNIELMTKLYNKALMVRVWKYRNLSIFRYVSGLVEKYYAVDIDKTPLLAVYCVQIAHLNLPPVRAGCQIGVWAASGNDKAVGIARAMFWDFLFTKHDMLADCSQTIYGWNFWQHRIDEAFDKNCTVYSIKYINGKIKDVKQIKNKEEFLNNRSKYWGSENHHLNTRLLITMHPLEFKGYQKSRSTTAEATMTTKLPDAWINAGIAKQNKLTAKSTTLVKARIDMSDETAGKGLCPECKKEMTASVANGHKGLICTADRIFLPDLDTQEYVASLIKTV